MSEFKYHNKDGLLVYTIPDGTVEKMFKTVMGCLNNTYPKPGKYVSAVLTINGNIYPGVSYCSDGYTLTMHGEATALAHAAIHGEKEVIAITGPNCHACKQLIWENALNSGIDIVVLIKENNTVKQIPISEMMVYGWPKNDNGKKVL